MARPTSKSGRPQPGIDDVNAKLRAEEARDAGIRISAVYVPTTESFVASDGTNTNGVTAAAADIAEMIMRNYQVITNGGFIKTNADGSGTAAAISLTIDECGSPGAVDAIPSPVQVPEPITIALFGAGLAGLAGYVRTKRKS